MELKKQIVKVAKEIIRETGGHPPKFFIELPDGRVAHVQVEGNINETIEELREVINQTGTTRYHSVVNTRIVDGGTVQNYANKRIKEYVDKGKYDKNSLSKLLETFALLAGSPKTNPAATEALVIATYDKVTGTDLEIYNYVKDKKGVTFLPKRKPKAITLSTPFNVWNPVQIDMRGDNK